MKKIITTALFAATAFTLSNCGPGLVVIPPPVITIANPADGATITTLSQTYSGTCENGLSLNVSYGDSVITGPLTSSCTNGTFSFNTTVGAVGGSHSVTLKQTDDNLHTGSATAAVNFSRVPFAQAKGFNGLVNAIYVDSNNAQFVGGAFTSFNGATSNHLVHLGSDGSLDSTFITGVGFNGTVNALAAAPDSTGDIYVGGSFTSYNANATAQKGIARLTNVGGLSTAFINAGFTGGTINTFAAAPDTSGDVYVGGTFTAYGTTTVDGIARVAANGSLSTTTAFNTGSGTAFNAQTVKVIAAAPDSSGDIYVGGTFTSYGATNNLHNIVRVKSDGTVNVAFAVIGAGLGFDGPVTTILPTKDSTGDIYVGGNFSNYGVTAVGHITRLRSDGSISPAFSSDGLFVSNVDQLIFTDSNFTELYAVGSFTSYGSSTNQKVIKITAAGIVDTAFISATSFDSGAEATCAALATDGSGNFYVGGNFVQYGGYGVNQFLRLSNTANLDTSFNIGAGFNGPVRSILPISDGTGDVYAGGNFTYYNGTRVNNFVRVQMGGILSTTLDTTAVGFTGGSVYAMANTVDGSGDIFVGGNFTTFGSSSAPGFARISSVGHLKLAPSGTGFNNIVMAIAPIASGAVYVGGTFTQYTGAGTPAPGIVRLTATGALDTFAFGTGVTNGAAAGEVDSIVAAADTTSDVIVAGQFDKYRGTASAGVARIQSTGVISPTFSANLQGGFGEALTLANDGSGDFYVGGQFTSYGGAPNTSAHVVRLKATGALSATFPVGTGFDGTVYALSSISGSSDVFAGGLFTVYNALSAINLGRITSAEVLGASMGTGPDGTVYRIVPAVDGSSDFYIGGTFQNFNAASTSTMARISSSGALD